MRLELGVFNRLRQEHAVLLQLTVVMQQFVQFKVFAKPMLLLI
jgi:hypothetical protein